MHLRRFGAPWRGGETVGEAPAPAEAEAGGPSAATAEAEAGGPSAALAEVTPAAPVVVPKWIQLVVLPLALLGLWALARASGTVLLILLIASVVALILNPLTKILQRRMPRGLAILAVYVAALAILVGIGVVLANPVGTQVDRFAKDVPQLVRDANRELDSVQGWLHRNGINVQIKQQGQTALQSLEKRVLKSSGSIVSFSRDLLGKVITLSFDAVLVLVLSIYLLVYAPRIGAIVRRVFPPGNGTPEDDYPLLVQRAVFGYVRGQLLFSLIMGASATVLLWLLGITGIFPAGSRYALFFGVFYGLMEMIPYIGPFLGAAPAVLVALFADPISALWVALMFLALQQLEGHVVAPQVFRISLRINPILVILALLVGYQLYGIIGALLALPVAAVIRQTLDYLRAHLVLESWNTPLALSGQAPSPASAPAAGQASEPCPHCENPTASDDLFCRSCGAPLLREDVSTLHKSG